MAPPASLDVPLPHANTNGTHTSSSQMTSQSLTEYSTSPSKDVDFKDPKDKVKDAGVPPEFLLPTGYPDYLRLILSSRVYDVIERTPLTHAVNISNRMECEVLLKREDLLPVFSFKLRGAYNKMAHLDPEERWKGVAACSAGNHAQGVAYSARKLKVPATICMPTGTPAIKHTNVSRLGASVVLHGQDFDEAKAHCAKLAKEHGLTTIPPFDDPYVIAGQGTIGLEISQQTNLDKLEAIFCCVGGGGLIAGVGVFIKRIAPHVKIIGVEAYDANAMVQSLALGKRVFLEEVGLFADGAAVKTVGEETFRICTDVVDEVIQVETDEICAAIKDVFEDTRSILEPAGALSLAGLKKYVAQNPSNDRKRTLVALASGANMNFDRLRFVAERAGLGEQKEALLSVVIPERPGSFATLIKNVYPAAVTEFSYRYTKPGRAKILMSIQVRPTTRSKDLAELMQRLRDEDMQADDLSDNELAKTHLRHLVGGISGAENERVFAFEFPERQGALYAFLVSLQPGFNISLFHYRNTGGDVAKVLAGIQCPAGEEPALQKFLSNLGYGWGEVTDNPAYKMFMRD